jgi:antitoxin VapB
MLATAKVFMTGNSQAIRLPKAFRVEAREMWITKNDVTGEITLKPKPGLDALAAFLEELKAMPITEDFIPPRDDASRPSPFEDWPE